MMAGLGAFLLPHFKRLVPSEYTKMATATPEGLETFRKRYVKVIVIALPDYRGHPFSLEMEPDFLKAVEAVILSIQEKNGNEGPFGRSILTQTIWRVALNRLTFGPSLCYSPG